MAISEIERAGSCVGEGDTNCDQCVSSSSALAFPDTAMSGAHSSRAAFEGSKRTEMRAK